MTTTQPAAVGVQCHIAPKLADDGAAVVSMRFEVGPARFEIVMTADDAVSWGPKIEQALRASAAEVARHNGQNSLIVPAGLVVPGARTP